MVVAAREALGEKAEAEAAVAALAVGAEAVMQEEQKEPGRGSTAASQSCPSCSGR